MIWRSFIFFLSFLSINLVIAQRSLVNEVRCPEKWSQFNHSCYLLSNHISTVGQANHTCDHYYLNNSRLMYIKQPVELFYAAHVLIKSKYNLNKLLVEIDQDLMKNGNIVHMLSSNDRVQWTEFKEKILSENFRNNKGKIQPSKQLSSKDKSYGDSANDGIADPKVNSESATVTRDDVAISNDDIPQSCDRIKWNVVDEKSNFLILTVELELNQSICSLSNADFTSAYYHLCQYILDPCLNYIKCGKHGRCVNRQTGVSCSCSFLYDGLYCEKYSRKDMQIIGTFIILVVTIMVTVRRVREWIWDVIKRLINLCRQPLPPPPVPPASERTDDENNHTEPPSDERSTESSINSPPMEVMEEFKLTGEEKKLRKRFLIILTIVSLLSVLKFPAIHHDNFFSLNNTNQSNVDLLVDNNVRMNEQYRRYTVLRLDNLVFLLVSGLLVFIFSILNKQEKRNQNDEDDRSGLVEPIKLLRITDRYTTTVIIVIQMFEILEALGETITDIDQSAQFGILVQILKRIFFIILIALRHYPTLASLQFQNIIVRLLIIVYFITSMVYMTFYRSSGTHWLLLLIKKLSSTQENLHIDLHFCSIVHSSIRNLLHYLLIGYICAELILRLLYDSVHIARKRGRKLFRDTPHRTIEQYSFKANHDEKRFEKNSNVTDNTSSDQQGCWISIQKCIRSIYKPDDKFRFTTIAICTYTVAYIFLFHLFGTVILLYQTQTNNYIRYIKHVFVLMLNIEMKEGSYQIEVFISAIMTTIIYGIQLFLSIKTFRQSMGDLYTKFSENPDLGKKLKKREIIRKSTQYPSYLLLYLLGGFFICFHLILLIVVTIKRGLFTDIGSSKGAVGYIIPILGLYLLQKAVIRWLHFVFDCFDQRNEKNLNLKLNILDSILLYLKLISCAFIGIIASIIRLIVSVLVNIIFMPRIDYSYLVEPLQRLDSAHEAFNAFLRLEILQVYPLILDFSSSVNVVSSITFDILLLDTLPPETFVEGLEREDYYDPENNDEDQSESSSMNEIQTSNHDAQILSFELQSQRRSSTRVREPMPSDIRSADDEEVHTRLLPLENT